MQSRILTSSLLMLITIAFLMPWGLFHWFSDMSSSVNRTARPAVDLYAPLPDFASIRDVHERKIAFFDFLLPLVRYANAELMETRQEVVRLQFKLQQGPLNRSEDQWLSALADHYRVSAEEGYNHEFFQTLLRRVDVIPASLVLAQAATESAWGTSRFAREGNNLFGQWCYSKGCGILPSRRDSGARHEVQKFSSPYASLRSYMTNLNRHETYLSLRKFREQARQNETHLSGRQLANGLRRYSERGDAYVQEIQAMIRHNDLSRFDNLAAAAANGKQS